MVERCSKLEREPFDGAEIDCPGANGKRGMELFHHCFDNGLLVRATGDIIALSPPLILEKAHIDEMIGRIGELVEGVA